MSAPSHSGSGDGPGTRVGNLNPCLRSCLGFLVADRTDSRLGGNLDPPQGDTEEGGEEVTGDTIYDSLRLHRDQLTLRGAWPLSGWLCRTMGCSLLAVGS